MSSREGWANPLCGMRLVAASIACALLLLSTAVADEAKDRDYYEAIKSPRAMGTPGGLLSAVEGYHWTATTFWKYFATGDLEHAIGELHFVLYVFPNHPTALHYITVVAEQARKPSLPMKYFQHAIGLYPQYAYTHAQFGRYLFRIGMLDDAKAKLEHAIEMDADLAPAYAWLSEVVRKQGDPDEATRLANRARDLGYGGESGDPPEGKTAPATVPR